GPGGEVVVAYKVPDEVLGRMQKAFPAGARLLLAAGAERVHLAVHGAEPLSSADGVDLSGVRASQIHWNAFHPLGTCRVGANGEEGGAALDGRVHGQERIFVADGSLFPASTQVNPQLAIMAMSLRVARGMLS